MVCYHVVLTGHWPWVGLNDKTKVYHQFLQTLRHFSRCRAWPFHCYPFRPIVLRTVIAQTLTLSTLLRVRIKEVKRVSPFPSCPGPLYQNEVKCSTFDLKMIFHSHANKTHFLKKGFALSLILNVRDFITRKGPISSKRTLKKFDSSQQHSLLYCLRFWFRPWSRNSYGNSRLRKSVMFHR